MNLKHSIRRFITDEQGATTIEYGLIAATLVIAIIGTLQSMQSDLKDTFNAVEAGMDTN